MGRLTDILANGGADRIRDAWNSTEAADEFGPLPPGRYIARLVAGELGTSSTNATPGYKLTFLILEGEHAGRRLWYDVWLTPAAMPMAKRDLAKLGVVSVDQLESPLPKGMRCRLDVALRTEDDGTQFNRVKRFDVIGIDPPDEDPFAPARLPTHPDNPPMNDGESGAAAQIVGSDSRATSDETIPF